MQVPDHANNSLQILLGTSLRTLRGLQLRLGLGLIRLLHQTVHHRDDTVALLALLLVVAEGLRRRA